MHIYLCEICVKKMKPSFYINHNSLLMKVNPRPKDRLTYYLGLTVDKMYWDSKNQKVKFNAPLHLYEYNKIIDTYCTFVSDLMLASKISGLLLTASELSNKLDQRFKVLSKDKTDNFVAYAQKFSSYQSSSQQRRTRSIIWAVSETLSFSDITTATLKDIDKKIASKYNQNTRKGIITQLNAILMAASDDGLYKGKKAKVPSAHIVDHIYLSDENILDFVSYIRGLDPDPKYKNAIALWLVMYFTGCRVSNITSVLHATKYYVNEEIFIRYTPVKNKTKKQVSIPYHELLSEVIQSVTHLISSQKLNTYIKEISKELNIPNYDKITNHTARRSCITNLVLNDMPLHLVMKISGHSTETELMRYVKHSDLVAALHIKNNVAFKKWSIDDLGVS
jgi:integrase